MTCPAGKKQTIAFASVYALNPDIFVLDEPSSNLDPEAIQELRRLLLLIKAQGKTIVVSEHRLYFLNGIADRIVLMEHGKLKQSWSARDFALLSTEQIKALGLRSYTPARLELPETMPSRNDTPAVEVKDLAIGYEKGKPVAQHLNFRVYPGEIVGVVGKKWLREINFSPDLMWLAEGTPWRSSIPKQYDPKQTADQESISCHAGPGLSTVYR